MFATHSPTSLSYRSKKQKQREAAIALTLVYSAYPTNPQLKWLGGNDSWWKAGGNTIRSRVRRRGTAQNQERDPSGVIVLTPPVQESLCDPSIIRHIAYSLQEMNNFFDVIDDPREIIADAVDRAKLVLVDRVPREVWFNGQRACDAIWDKHPKSWDLIWKLALNAGQVIDREVLVQCSEKAFRSRRNRLAELLGDESQLDAVIETLPGLGYKLDLDGGDVIRLQDDGFGNLKAFSQSAARLGF